jgi:hypothetical protein
VAGSWRKKPFQSRYRRLGLEEGGGCSGCRGDAFAQLRW